MTRIEKGPGWELRLGRWQDVLADVAQVDSVITDPPYSERTHAGHNAVDSVALPGEPLNNKKRYAAGLDAVHIAIDYMHMSPQDVVDFMAHWAHLVTNWICAHTDNALTLAYQQAADARGLTSFQPVPCVVRGMTVRLAGDGPSSWATYLMVARTKAAHKWGTLPGAYITGQGERMIAGSKSVQMMRAIVRDYSRHGDLVCDPYAGSGTTLLAAVMEGRRAIGAEMDEGRFDMAVRRLRAGFTTDLFGGA